MDKLYIIKIGGNIIDDATQLGLFLTAFAQLPGHRILVHGGGKLATRLAADLGVEQRLVDGRRITDAETLKIVTMVYAGYINKNIVATLQSLGVNAIGLTGADGNAIAAHQRVKADIDYGYAGDVDQVNVPLLSTLLHYGQSLVFAPITHDGKGQLLNTNADTIAQELATGLGQQFDVTLIYSFEKKGVLLDAMDENSLIPELGPVYYEKLRASGAIFAGMIPKLDNAFAALRRGVSEVIIGNAGELQDLVNGRTGTSITLKETAHVN